MKQPEKIESQIRAQVYREISAWAQEQLLAGNDAYNAALTMVTLRYSRKAREEMEKQLVRF